MHDAGEYREFTVRFHPSMEPVLLMIYRHVAFSQQEAGWPLSKRSPLAWGRVIELIFADWIAGERQPIDSKNARVDAAAVLLLSFGSDELRSLKENLKMAKCPDCENGLVEAIDNGPTGISVDSWIGIYPKLKTVDCDRCDGSGDVFDVAARCRSDDGRIDIQFDAVDYLKQCSVKKLVELILCDWSGDYPADAVAEFFRATTTAQLFSYLDLLSNMELKESTGFECSLDGETAWEWLEVNRPGDLVKAQEAVDATHEAIAVEPEAVWGETIDWGGNGDA